MTKTSALGEATIRGWSTNDDVSYWRSHPDVIAVESVATKDSKGDTRYNHLIWLNSIDEAQHDFEPEDTAEREQKPSREPDVSIFVDGAPNVSFMNRCPPAEYRQYFIESGGDEDAPDGWWVLEIWTLAEETTARAA